MSGLDDCRPLLYWDVRISTNPSTVELETEEATFEVKGILPEAARRLLSLLDGARPLAVAAREAGVEQPQARALLETLLAQDLVMDVSRHPERFIEPEVFARGLRRLYTGWKDELFSHELWATLTSGEAPRPVFMGWLIENYHFIEGVNDRLALAAAECSEPAVRSLFVKHYTEEWDHGGFFLHALRNLGVGSADVLSTRPLPGTWAVLNHMRHCARRGPIEYASCSGFLESTGEDRTKTHLFFDMLSRNYSPEKPTALKPLVDHANLDEAYQHNSVLEDLCTRLEPIPLGRASAAITQARLLVETLMVWSTDILRFYGESFTLRRGFKRHRPERLAAAPSSPIN